MNNTFLVFKCKLFKYGNNESKFSGKLYYFPNLTSYFLAGKSVLKLHVDAMSGVDSKQDTLKRVYLWANARSLGTIFLKWLSHVPDAQIINGIFSSCYFFGPESSWDKDAKQLACEKARDSNLSDFPFVYDASKITYQSAKTYLERDYPGKKYLICKDQAFCLCGNHDLIPKGFRHTFLIRHPFRVYPSWKNAFGKYFPEENSLKDIIEKSYNQYYSYKEQYELIEYLRNNPNLGDSNPVIFDADDLQNHPASILKQYCQTVEIPFVEDMLHWAPGINVVKNWKIASQLIGGGIHGGEYGFYKTAMESSEFLPCKKLPERNELEQDILECSDIGMPYYEKLYEMRTIRP